MKPANYLAVFSVLITGAFSSTKNLKLVEDYRLPESLIPLEYQIQLTPYLLESAPPENFDGHVEILFKSATPTNLIRMHALDLDVLEDTVRVSNADTGDEVGVSGMTMADDDTHFLDFALDAILDAGANYSISVDFAGNFSDDAEGFYRSSYFEDGEEKWLLLTRFEPTFARKAFPCFDEPGLKAIFKISIARPHESWTVLSNMEAIAKNSELEHKDWTWVNFEATPSMSTYLVAFSVSRFESVTNERDTRFKTWTRPAALHAASYVTDFAPMVFEYLEAYFEMEFPLPKVDQFAVPEFTERDIGNWGHIVARESAVLQDKTLSSAMDEQRMVRTVGHSLSHQYFGTLVTPKWWNHLWLGAGIATYFEHELAYTEWRLDGQLVLEHQHPAFEVDAIEQMTQPVVLSDLASPSSIQTACNSISVSKGALQMRLIAKSLGADLVGEGIRNYLSLNKMQTTETDDFWEALQNVLPENLLPPGMNLKEIMDTWTLQSGFPVITFERLYDDGRRAIVSQERFMSSVTKRASTEQWVVPLTFTSQLIYNFEDLTPDAWLTAPNMVLENVAFNEEWVVVNKQQIGFYRVNYDVQNWKLLAKSMNKPEVVFFISEINRAQVMSDALALARANYLDYHIALEMTNYLNYETEYMPWATAISTLGYIRDRLASEQDSLNLVDNYLLTRLEKTYEREGGFEIPGFEYHAVTLVRNLVLQWVCKLGHEECNRNATELFNYWRRFPDPDGYNPVYRTFKSTVYCVGIREGLRDDWDFLYERYLKAIELVNSEEIIILEALACSKDTQTLNEYLELCIQGNSSIRSHEIATVITSVFNNPIGLEVALDFMISQFSVLQNRLGVAEVANLFWRISSKLNTQEHLNKLQQFYDQHAASFGEAARVLIGALSNVEEILNWHESYKDTVVSYLAAKNNSSPLLALVKPWLLLVALFSLFIGAI